MAVSMDNIKKLKSMTGAGIVDCKAVLKETNGDMDEAVNILRKKGLAKAAKKAGRDANEGLILTKISDDHKKGVIVRVNCETDFVAKTDDFKNFANKVLDTIYEKEFEQSSELPEELEEMRKNIIAKLGENILISEWAVVKDANWLFPYTHMGKVGVLVDFSADKHVHDDDDAETFMKNVAMQITAMAPLAVDRDSLPQKELENEKSIYMEEARKTGKPENILEKIIEGKMKKFYQENVLLEQVFMLDEDGKLTIKDVIDKFNKDKGVSTKVDSFVRVSL